MALADYGLGDARVSLLKETFNTVFRVDARDGQPYTLRVGARERIHPPETERIETAWLHALAHDTDIGAPQPIANRAAEYVTTASDDGVPEPRTCVLFEWAGGRRLTEIMNDELATRAGTLLARLHAHAASFDGGRWQPVLQGDRVLTFAIDDRIPRADPEHGTLYADALARATAAVESLWHAPPHVPHLLHGDFHPNNILVARGRITPLDFQDVLWGFEIQDVAITAFSLERFTDPAGLLAALRAGYEQERPWPVRDDTLLGDLVAARHLDVLNLGFNLRRAKYDAFVARHTAWLRDWMRGAG